MQLPRSNEPTVQPGDFARVALTARKAIGVAGLAVVQRWDRTLADWVAGTEERVVADPLHLFEGWEGDVCLVQFRFDTRAWEIIAPTQRTCRFELTGTLNKGSSAPAKIRYYDTDDEEWKTSEFTLTVWDADNLFSGVSGDKGRAEWRYDSRRWEVAQKNC